MCNAGHTSSGGAQVALTTTVTFPITTDSHARYLPYFWNAGDEFTGVRATSLPSVIQATIHLAIIDNVLACDTQDTEMLINGVVVGHFSITAGADRRERVRSRRLQAPRSRWNTRPPDGELGLRLRGTTATPRGTRPSPLRTDRRLPAATSPAPIGATCNATTAMSSPGYLRARSKLLRAASQGRL